MVTMHKDSPRRRGFWSGLASMVLLVCFSGSGESKSVIAPARSDLEVVDCLLPGSVRIVGGRTYLSSRRPTKTLRNIRH